MDEVEAYANKHRYSSIRLDVIDTNPNAKRLYSQLEVTRNPSDHWPTLAVIIIGISMSLAMSIRLMGYMRQQASRRLGEGKS